MTTPLEARVKAGCALRIPIGKGYTDRITFDARMGWYLRERRTPDDAWLSRSWYPRWDELRDEVDLSEAREESKPCS